MNGVAASRTESIPDDIIQTELLITLVCTVPMFWSFGRFFMAKQELDELFTFLVAHELCKQNGYKHHYLTDKARLGSMKIVLLNPFLSIKLCLSYIWHIEGERKELTFNHNIKITSSIKLRSWFLWSPYSAMAREPEVESWPSFSSTTLLY